MSTPELLKLLQPEDFLMWKKLFTTPDLYINLTYLLIYPSVGFSFYIIILMLS